MAITWPTKSELQEKFLGWYRTFFPNISVARGTDPWLESHSVTGVAGMILARAKQIYAAIFITTATGSDLDEHGETYLPEDKRRKASSGTTSGEITLTGTATAVPTNTKWVHADGTEYYNSDAVSVADWAGGSVDVDVLSSDTGQICNKTAGEILTIVTPISGVDDEATVKSGSPLAGATDEETDDEYRTRILSWLQNPPGGGNYGHYKNYAEGVGGCEKAYVYPHFDRDGDGNDDLGTVDIVCLGPGVTSDVPTGDRFNVDVNAVWDELAGEVRPCTADLGTRGVSGVLIATEQTEPVDVDVTVHDGYEYDWSGSFTVTSMTGDTQLNLSSSPVGTISEGDRVLFNVQVGTDWQPCVRVVAAGGVTATHIIVTESFPSSTPDTGSGGLKPAGPGTQDQLDAILDVFDGLTPGDTANATRRPAVSADHPTDLIKADIVDALQSLASVKNTTVNQPTVDKTPTDAKYLIRNGKIYIEPPP